MEPAELEAAIRSAPEDLALRTVYADALQERGDPFGEHLAFALRPPHDDATWWRVWAWEREAAARLATPLAAEYCLRMTWRDGFVDELTVTRRNRNAPSVVGHPKLHALLDQPELAALRSLDLRGAYEPRPDSLRATIELVRNFPVRRLGFGPELDFTTEALAELVRACPRLDGLALNGRGDTLVHEISRWHQLRALDISSGIPPARLVEAAAGLDLERFVIHLVRSEPFDIAALAPILAGRAMPRLREFGVIAPLATTTAVCRALADSPLLDRLDAFGVNAPAVYDNPGTQSWFRAHAERLARCSLFTQATIPGDNTFEAGRLGLLLLRMGRAREGIAELAHHLDMSGHVAIHATCWAELGECFIGAGRPDLALAPIDRGLAFGPKAVSRVDLVEIWRTRAIALTALGRHDDAIAACREGLASDRTDIETWHLYEQALTARGRRDDARLASDVAYYTEHRADISDDDRARLAAGLHFLLGG